MLRKQLDELREEKSKEKMMNAKLAAKVCVCMRMIDMVEVGCHS